MKKEVRKLLDVIDQMLIGPHGTEVVDILSAIRGPDSGNYYNKRASTNIIRQQAFPFAFEKAVHSGNRWDVTDTSLEFGELVGESWHFLNHIQLARKVLEAV